MTPNFKVTVFSQTRQFMVLRSFQKSALVVIAELTTLPVPHVLSTPTMCSNGTVSLIFRLK